MRKNVEPWYGVPDELPDEHRKFMMDHDLKFSSGYIGMIRCYKGNRTVWQGNGTGLKPVDGMEVILSSHFYLPSTETLNRAGREWLETLMAMDEQKLAKALGQDVPLIGSMS